MSSNLPKSAVIVLSGLTHEGPMTPKSIIKKLKLPSRTVTYALRTLIDENIVRKIPNLNDMRQPIYHVNIERVKELQLMYRIDQVARIRAETRLTGHTSSSFIR